MAKGRSRLLAYLGIGVFGYWLLLGLAPGSLADSISQAVEFNRDIRPILSDKCFTCHGPDPSQRMSKLRLDTEAGAFADLGERFAIVPGEPARSEMYRRISSSEPAVRMPPAFSGRTLTPQQIDLIRRWIEQGAKWQAQHWSFIPPRTPALPRVHNRSWPRNSIDFFVLERLEREGLSPSGEADKATLIRRVSLDLTGLPPTPAEIDAFLQDPSPNAYEKVVDRLLDSPRYGERMAAQWLNAARYADTNGYQTDAERSMWRWRDWVIDAFNRNMPFDQFTIEQIAGDMLPNPTLEQRIATGFNRNHRGNGEGGVIPEEFAVEYVVDRLETTSTVWLGLTLGCARCHDHKYDPFTQKDFYRLFAYFNNVPEKGRANKYGNSPPMIKAPTDAQKAQVQELERKLEAAEKKFAKLETAVAEAQRSWEKEFARTQPADWSVARGLVVHYRLDGDLGGKPDCALAQEGEPAFVTGRVGQAASFDGKHFLNAGDIAGFGFYDKFTLAAWVYPTAAQGAIVANAEDVSEPLGYGLYLKKGKVQINLVVRWLDDALRVQTEGALELNRWHHVLATYDGSHLADGVRIYVDGEPQELEVLLDELSQSFHFPEHRLRIGAGGGPENRFRGYVDDVRVYKVVLRPDEAAVVATSSSIAEILALPSEKRSRLQSGKIKLYFLEEQAPAEIRQAWAQVRDLRVQKQKFWGEHSHHHGHAGARDAAPDSSADPGSLRPAGREGHSWSSCCPCPLAAGLGKQPLGVRALAGAPVQSTDGTCHRESLLADVLRQWAGQDCRKLRFTRGMAHSSRTPRLARCGVCPDGLECQGDAAADCEQRDLPAVLPGNARVAAEGSRESLAGSRHSVPLVGGNGPRPGACDGRAHGRKNRRTLGQTLPTCRLVEGAVGR